MTTGVPPHDWSQSQTAVLERIQTALENGREAVVVTVADVDGHAYRRTGAKLVIDDAGTAGSVTAGCLSDEVQQLARRVRESGTPCLNRFDLREDETWGLGLGCNGVIELLAEPIDKRFSALVDGYAAGDDGVGLVVIEADDCEDIAVGDRAYAPAGQATTAGRLPDWLLNEVENRYQRLLEQDQSAPVTVTGPTGSELRVLIDTVQAPPELYLFGVGNDVNPISELAVRAGFKVTVVSFRGGRADADTFPHADRVITTSAPRIDESLSFDDDTYAVLMTHNAVDDRIALAGLLETPVPYIGLMGPTERFRKIRRALAEEDQPITETDLERIYTPVGLSLGGGDPYQIAMSIVSEVLAVSNSCAPDHLRERDGPIHNRSKADR